MYIYNYNKDKLDVYRLTAGSNNLINFRNQELTYFETAGNILVYNLHQFNGGETYNEFRMSEVFAYKKLENRKQFRNFTELNKDEYFTDHIKNLYIKGDLKDKALAKVMDYDNILKHYFMEVENVWVDGKERRINDFINLPESLFYLEQFEQGKFSKLFLEASPEVVEKILSLYTITKDFSWERRKLGILEQEGLLKSFDYIESNMEYSTEIIRRVRTLD